MATNNLTSDGTSLVYEVRLLSKIPGVPSGPIRGGGTGEVVGSQPKHKHSTTTIPWGSYWADKGQSPAEAPSGVSSRPRREVEVELLRELRAKGYGYKRIAGEYTRATSEYISHTTVRERLVGD